MPTWDTWYLSSRELISKNVKVAGLNIGDFIESRPSDVKTILDKIFELHLQEKIKPQIHSILPFEKIADGLELLCRRQNFGKVLLKVRDESEQIPSPPKPKPGCSLLDDHDTLAVTVVDLKRQVREWKAKSLRAEQQRLEDEKLKAPSLPPIMDAEHALQWIVQREGEYSRSEDLNRYYNLGQETVEAPSLPPNIDTSPLVPQVGRVIEATKDTRVVPSVVLNEHWRLDRISVVDAPLPKYMRNDHVEVQVYYCGLNLTDNYLRLGIIRNKDFPIIMGSECCGVVRLVGPEVDDLQVGQRVVCLRMQGGLFRRVVQVPRANVFPLPPTIGLKDAMALALDALVAYFCLFELGRIRRDAVVFMQSIGGGVGTMVAQLARTVPLVTVLGTASEEKHDRLRRLGVKYVYRHQDNYVERVLRLHPEGADIVIIRSGAQIDKSLRLLKPCGTLIIIGSDSTAIYQTTKKMPTWDTRYLSSRVLISKNVKVAGLNIGDFIESRPSDVKTILDKIFELHLQEKIKPQIQSILPIEEIADGLELLCRRQNFGKVLLELRNESRLMASPPKPDLGSSLLDDVEKFSETVVDLKRKIRQWNAKKLKVAQHRREGEEVVPEGEEVVPEGEEVVPEGEEVVPEGEEVVPEGEEVVPEGEEVVPEGEEVVPEGEEVVPEGEEVVPEGEEVVPEGEEVASDEGEFMTWEGCQRIQEWVKQGEAARQQLGEEAANEKVDGDQDDLDASTFT